MKVICINENWVAAEGKVVPDCAPKEGEDYTVITFGKCGCGCNVDVYKLAECGEYGYDATHFIRLSSIDETEMTREYQKQTV